MELGNLRITYDKQDEQLQKNFVKISKGKSISSCDKDIGICG